MMLTYLSLHLVGQHNHLRVLLASDMISASYLLAEQSTHLPTSRSFGNAREQTLSADVTFEPSISASVSFG